MLVLELGEESGDLPELGARRPLHRNLFLALLLPRQQVHLGLLLSAAAFVELHLNARARRPLARRDHLVEPPAADEGPADLLGLLPKRGLCDQVEYLPAVVNVDVRDSALGFDDLAEADNYHVVVILGHLYLEPGHALPDLHLRRRSPALLLFVKFAEDVLPPEHPHNRQKNKKEDYLVREFVAVEGP